jgi:RsiW-degrading membrane proteinase PrsW (M82 family)
VTFFLQTAVSGLPVFFCLAALVLTDSYKLVGLREILSSTLAGGLAALASYFANTGLHSLLDLELPLFSRYVAPVVEESFKAVFLVYLLRSSTVGFVVDAAIHGFAIGTGFGFLENLYYLQAVPDATLWTWIVRGFGTATMHGGATAAFAMVSKTFRDRADSYRFHSMLPGLGLAVAMHSLYNHFLLHPLLAAALLIFVFPIVSIGVFQRSEKATRDWLGAGFDADQELLEVIRTGHIAETRVGAYLVALRSRFPGEVIVDMMCLLRLHVELSIRAKGVLMMREAGFDVAPDPTLKATFKELRYLEKSIGKTGRLAIDPFLHTSTRDLWQLNMLHNM